MVWHVDVMMMSIYKMQICQNISYMQLSIHLQVILKYNKNSKYLCKRYNYRHNNNTYIIYFILVSRNILSRVSNTLRWLTHQYKCAMNINTPFEPSTITPAMTLELMCHVIFKPHLDFTRYRIYCWYVLNTQIFLQFIITII